jgi:CheY-like chemotaxis protein
MVGKTLLCVDDEVVGLQVRKLVLERQGYTVLTAHRGADGLRLFEQNDVDAVVLDYMMPGMTGAAVASCMKKTKPEVPIILFSSYLSLPKRELASVDAFLLKGDSPESLLQKIAEITQSVST